MRQSCPDRAARPRTRARYTVSIMNYDCFEYKSSQETRRLSELEEGRGKLLRVLILEGFAVAVFPWGAISLPVEMREQLEPLVGKEVCCLRLDGKFHVREAK